MMYRIGRKSRLSAPVRRPLAWSPAESAATVACWALAGWVLAGAARRVSVRTGVSDEEAFAPLPGGLSTDPGQDGHPCQDGQPPERRSHGSILH